MRLACSWPATLIQTTCAASFRGGRVAGRLYQLRRGVYTLVPPFQKVKPHPFVIANALAQPSYVSLHATLASYGLISTVPR